MTRQLSYVMIIAGIIAFLGLPAPANAQHQWTSLDGPYWANGIDVAYGMGSPGQDWHRYLIGSNDSQKMLFWSNEEFPTWREWDELPGANKLVSYKQLGSGQFALCAAYDDDVYRTTDGGLQWTILDYSMENKAFNALEIVNWTQEPGAIVIVGNDYVENEPSAYYTDDYGDTWHKLGDGVDPDPLDGLDVFDIETLAEQADFPIVTAGTANGIYRHEGEWNTPWAPVQFEGKGVPVLESIDNWTSQSQVAAVIDHDIWRLYFTQDAWINQVWEITTGPGNLFNKEVRDISAIYYEGNPAYVTCYVATDEGVYMVDFDIEAPDRANQYDLKSYYSPMQYDKNIIAVDYFFKQEGEYYYSYVVATTPYNVYEIVEQRDSGHGDPVFTIQEIVSRSGSDPDF